VPAPTLSTVIAAARHILQDEDAAGYRVTQARMLRVTNDYLHKVRRDEPDKFFGQLTATVEDLAESAEFPLGWEDVDRAASFVVSRIDLIESEFAAGGRVASMVTLSERG